MTLPPQEPLSFLPQSLVTPAVTDQVVVLLGYTGPGTGAPYLVPRQTFLSTLSNSYTSVNMAEGGTFNVPQGALQLDLNSPQDISVYNLVMPNVGAAQDGYDLVLSANCHVDSLFLFPYAGTSFEETLLVQSQSYAVVQMTPQMGHAFSWRQSRGLWRQKY